MAKKSKKATRKAGRRGGRKPGQWVHVTREAVGEFRKGAGVSRGKLAEMLGVSSTSIQNWETGHAVPMLRYQQKLAEFINGGAAKETREREPARRSLPSTSPVEVEVTRLTVVGEILKGYLATPRGGKVSLDQLVALTVTLRGALS